MDSSNLLLQLQSGPLASRAADIAALVKPTIILKTERTQRVAFKSSKLGGNPDLPDSLKWPKSKNGIPLVFIAQLNLDEIACSDQGTLLPQTGVLYLFLDLDDGDLTDPESNCPNRLLYQDDLSLTRFPLERPEFQQAPKPPTLLNQFFSLLNLTDSPAPLYQPYEQCAVSFHESISLPFWDSFPVDNLKLDKTELKTFRSLYDSLIEHHYKIGGAGRLLGYADPVQNNDMDVICYLESRGEKIHYPIPLDHGTEVGASEWTLLLQMENIDECGMYWGDGLLYLWSRKTDLGNRDFSQSRLIGQFT